MRAFGNKNDDQNYEIEKELSMVLFNRRGEIAVVEEGEEYSLPSYAINSADLVLEVSYCKDRFSKEHNIELSELEYIEKAVTFLEKPSFKKLKTYFYMSEVSFEEINSKNIIWISPAQAMAKLKYEAYIWAIRQAIENSIDL